MAKRTRITPDPKHTWRIVRNSLLGFAAAQGAALLTVHAVDHLRKARIPGGVHGFPATEPLDVMVEDNDLRLYTEGQSLYADMLETINSAKKYIYFETYAWRSDQVGQAFKNALYAAADRGVDVFVVYDGFGTLNQNPLFKIFKRHPKMHVHRLAEIRAGLFTLDLRRTGRTHRKMLIADDKVGFLGGFNIGIDFGSEWRDTHVRVKGNAVEELIEGFVEFWNSLRETKPKLARRFIKHWRAPISAEFNMPSRLLFPVRGLYLDAMERARDHIFITTAYFIPDKEILNALMSAVLRGVKVKVLIPEYSNHILADWVARPFFGDLLAAGVEIWLYQHAMIHSKTMTVDGIWSTVGTANIDRLSLMGNFEVNLQVYSQDFANALEKIFAHDLTTARQLSLQEWQDRSALTRLGETLLKPFNAIV